MLQTEFEFTLPKGYVDAQGQVHQHGAMRLATALDEISAVRDPRVAENEAYLSVILLSRVVTRLGTLAQVTTDVLESIFSADLAYLESFYRWINDEVETTLDLTCPHCRQGFAAEVSPLGG